MQELVRMLLGLKITSNFLMQSIVQVQPWMLFIWFLHMFFIVYHMFMH